MKKLTISLILTLFFSILSTNAVAQKNQTITMYELPTTQAKTIGQLNTQKTINIVESGWLYVFNPQTKKAGWVKQEALQNTLGQNVNYSTRIIQTPSNNGNGFKQTITYSYGPHMNDKQAKAFWQKEKAREKALFKQFHRSMKAMEDLFSWPYDIEPTQTQNN